MLPVIVGPSFLLRGGDPATCGGAHRTSGPGWRGARHVVRRFRRLTAECGTDFRNRRLNLGFSGLCTQPGPCLASRDLLVIPLASVSLLGFLARNESGF